MMKLDKNKAYFDAPYDDLDVIAGIGKDCIAFGKKVDGGGEKFVYFKKSDWENLKGFIDSQMNEY